METSRWGPVGQLSVRVLEKGLTRLGLVFGDLGEGLKKQGLALA